MNETSIRSMHREVRPGELPWWRYRMVWLVIGGPMAVVVASLVTAVIAMRGADPVVSGELGGTASQRPAIQARNHAATPADRH